MYYLDEECLLQEYKCALTNNGQGIIVYDQDNEQIVVLNRLITPEYLGRVKAVLGLAPYASYLLSTKYNKGGHYHRKMMSAFKSGNPGVICDVARVYLGEKTEYFEILVGYGRKNVDGQYRKFVYGELRVSNHKMDATSDRYNASKPIISIVYPDKATYEPTEPVSPETMEATHSFELIAGIDFPATSPMQAAARLNRLFQMVQDKRAVGREEALEVLGGTSDDPDETEDDENYGKALKYYEMKKAMAQNAQADKNTVPRRKRGRPKKSEQQKAQDDNLQLIAEIFSEAIFRL